MRICKLMIIAMIASLSFVFLNSCSTNMIDEAIVENESIEIEEAIVEIDGSEDEAIEVFREPEEIGAYLDFWCVYWDYAEGLYEMDDLHAFAQAYDLPKDIQFCSADMFALDFYSDMSLHFSNKVDLNRFKTDKEKYITIVNDVIEPDGKNIIKDGEIITKIMLSDENRKKHMEDILTFMMSHDFDGVTLDYEKVESQAWDAYATFIDELGQLLKKNGYKLRVVLETRCPVEKIDFPQGYQYIFMCYNLYGWHSGPGPKADYAYIEQTCERLKNNFDDGAIAFSLGGFDWYGDEINTLTFTQAQELIKTYQVEIKRDAQSEVAYFEYQDSGVNHTVWYCDGQTLNGWIESAKSKGIYSISIWRLGGNLVIGEEHEEK